MKKIFMILTAGIFLAMAVSSVYAYEAFQGPTELIQYNPEKAYNGYTMFSPFRGKNTYLIDMEGLVVHMWPYPTGWGREGSEAVEKHARLLEDGTLLRGTINRAAGDSDATYQIIDWDGTVTWQYNDPREDHRAHHDFRMIWNKELQKNTLMFVSSRDITHEEAIAAGCDPALREDYTSRPDGIVEVDIETKTVIWEWNISDHLIQDVDDTKANFGVVADHPEKYDPNFGSGRRGDWIHINSFDYNEVLGQVVINNSRESEFYIVDHGATFITDDPAGSIALAAGDAGDFLFRWGNPCVYDAGDCPSWTEIGGSSHGHQQTFFTHDVQWIREKEVKSEDWALPGAGNFLIFDNGSRRLTMTQSVIFEINPYDGDWRNGVYIPEMVGGHDGSTSNQIVWDFRSKMNSFYGSYISGCQRLPNGNTYIDSGPHGHFFEVTQGGELVWEYVNPVGDRTRGEYGIYKFMKDTYDRRFNSVFRSHRYGPDYPGLAGKDLTPMGPITEMHVEGALDKFRDSQMGFDGEN